MNGKCDAAAMSGPGADPQSVVRAMVLPPRKKCIAQAPSHTHRVRANSRALCPTLKDRGGWGNTQSVSTVVGGGVSQGSVNLQRTLASLLSVSVPRATEIFETRKCIWAYARRVLWRGKLRHKGIIRLDKVTNTESVWPPERKLSQSPLSPRDQ